MDAQTSQEPKSTLSELAEIRAQARAQASQKGEAELPEGSSPLEARVEEQESSEVSEAPPAEVKAAKEPETLIRIGDREFKTQSEAIKYAEQLEYEKLAAEAYTQGIRDSLQANQSQVKPPEPEDDKFDEKFYSNPKEVLNEVRQRARDEAIAAIKAEQNRENLWGKFFEDHPDLAGHRMICEQVLSQNWDTLGAMTDVPKAMKILATKTRSIFQDYMDRNKPRVELPNRGGQVVSAGSSVSPGVTPQKKADEPIDFTAQMRKLRART